MSVVRLVRRFALPVMALLGSALAGGCTAADNLSYDEIAGELDRIVRVRGSGADRRLDYADTAEVSVWYMRNVLFVPFRLVLGFVAGATTIVELENPSRHVRELIAELPDEAGSALDEGADAIARLLLIAELDVSPANVTTALDSAVRVMRQLGLDGVGDPSQLGLAVEPARLDAARGGVQLSRPKNRASERGTRELTPAERAAYLDALAVLVERPLPQWGDRIALVGDLRELWLAETDRTLRGEVADRLRSAIAHAVRGALIRALQRRDAGGADVRLCAIQQFRGLGGKASVPFLLALMAASAGEAGSIAERFDRDPVVRLRLIHLCGQLRGDDALATVQLPGRESWDTIAPADFLAQVALTERAYYSKLRVPALTALCLCLGKTRLDYDLAWVEAWYRDRQRS
ncbi:MAG: hypothetical protein KDE27_16810 [Planctomycetes bacterium]|nr:hypothetical protein [Planctomycetota bacterium]